MSTPRRHEAQLTASPGETERITRRNSQRHQAKVNGSRGATRIFSRVVAVSDTSYLQLLPAVDIAGGQAVQLVQGVAGSEKLFGDPVAAALRWQEAGAEWIHLVDLDAAFGRGHNRELQAEIVGRLDIDVEMSGGIRDDESLAAAMATGCRRVNIGTAALEAARVVRQGHRRVGRPGRGRPRRARPDAGRARLDPRGRRPVRRPRPARRRGLRALRGHRRRQGRHAAGSQPSAPARRVRRHRPAGRGQRRHHRARRPPSR